MCDLCDQARQRSMRRSAEELTRRLQEWPAQRAAELAEAERKQSVEDHLKAKLDDELDGGSDGTV